MTDNIYDVLESIDKTIIPAILVKSALDSTKIINYIDTVHSGNGSAAYKELSSKLYAVLVSYIDTKATNMKQLGNNIMDLNSDELIKIGTEFLNDYVLKERG